MKERFETIFWKGDIIIIIYVSQISVLEDWTPCSFTEDYTTYLIKEGRSQKIVEGKSRVSLVVTGFKLFGIVV